MATLKVAPISKKEIQINWKTNINGLKTVHKETIIIKGVDSILDSKGNIPVPECKSEGKASSWCAVNSTILKHLRDKIQVPKNIDQIIGTYTNDDKKADKTKLQLARRIKNKDIPKA